jgi:hypothetical protein
MRINENKNSFRVLQDGRLRPDDRLVELNGAFLIGLSNSEAMKALRQALRPGVSTPGCVDVVVARQRSAIAAAGIGDWESTPRRPIRYADANQQSPTTSGDKTTSGSATSKAGKPTNVLRNVSYHLANGDMSLSETRPPDGADCGSKRPAMIVPTASTGVVAPTIISGNCDTVLIETECSRGSLRSSSRSSSSRSSRSSRGSRLMRSVSIIYQF